MRGLGDTGMSLLGIGALIAGFLIFDALADTLAKGLAPILEFLGETLIPAINELNDIIMDHPVGYWALLGASGFHYGGYGVCIPMDMKKDAKSGESIPSLRIRYKAANGYSRDMEHWLTGSAVLQNKTNTSDVLQSHFRCERGFEGFAANRYMLIKKS